MYAGSKTKSQAKKQWVKVRSHKCYIATVIQVAAAAANERGDPKTPECRVPKAQWDDTPKKISAPAERNKAEMSQRDSVPPSPRNRVCEGVLVLWRMSIRAFH